MATPLEPRRETPPSGRAAALSLADRASLEALADLGMTDQLIAGYFGIGTSELDRHRASVASRPPGTPE